MKNVTQGQLIRLTATFRDIDNVLVDPTTVQAEVFTVADGDSSTNVYNAPGSELLRTSAGVYYIDVDTSGVSGVYRWRFSSTGTGQNASQGEFYVVPETEAVPVDAPDPTLRESLAASGGSALIGYIAAGLSAIWQTVQAKLRRWVEPDDYDGTDAGEKIAAAIAALPATGGTVNARGMTGAQTWAADPFAAVGTKPVTLILGAAQFAAASSVTIPSSVTVKCDRGAKITIATTKTITVHGEIRAGAYTVFGWAGTGAISFSTISRTYKIPVEWFGAVGDGTTDDRDAINKALASVADTEGTVTLRRCEYKITSGGLTCGSVRLIGKGMSSNLVFSTAAGVVNCLTASASERNGLVLRDFQITATTTQVDGVEINAAHAWHLQSVFINTVGGVGFQINNSNGGTSVNCGVSTADRGIEFNRVVNGSGGTTVVGLLTSDIVGVGAVVDDSTAVAFINCELNVYGASSVGGWFRNGASCIEVSGGLWGGNAYSIVLGQAGTTAISGVSVHGALLSAGDGGGGTGTPIVGSSAVYGVTGKFYAVDVRGNHIQNHTRCFTTTGLFDQELQIGQNYVSTLAAPGIYIDSNGTTLVDASGVAVAAGSPVETLSYQRIIGTTAAVTYLPAGVIYRNVTAVGNITGGEDDLMTYTLPANILGVAGRGIRVTAWGHTGANANGKTLIGYAAGTAIITNGPTNANNQKWSVVYDVTTATGAGSLTGLLTVVTWNGASVVPTTVSVTADMTAAQIFKFTGTSATNTTDDVIQDGMKVELLP